MRIPFCEGCREIGGCEKCVEALRAGIYNEDDLRVLEAVLELEKRLPHVGTLEYVKSHVIEGLVVVVMLRGLKSLDRKTVSELERGLSSALGKTVRLVDASSQRDIVLQLLAPARSVFITTSWLPDGTSELIVKIPIKEANRLPFRPRLLENILRSVIGGQVRLEVVSDKVLT